MTAGFNRHELARRRRDQGLSQDDLAAALNVTQQAVSTWERGVFVPDIDHLPVIALKLKCNIDDLFYPVGPVAQGVA